MTRINWPRILLGGFVAFIVWTILDSLVTAWLGHDFAVVPGNRLATPTPGFIAFLLFINLLEGISIIWLYAAIRPRYGPGVKTAVIAASAWWFIVSLGDATWCSFGFFPPRTVVPLMIATLPALNIATLVGAWLYGE
jgi:hypothetical protein